MSVTSPSCPRGSGTPSKGSPPSPILETLLSPPPPRPPQDSPTIISLSFLPVRLWLPPSSPWTRTQTQTQWQVQPRRTILRVLLGHVVTVVSLLRDRMPYTSDCPCFMSALQIYVFLSFLCFYICVWSPTTGVVDDYARQFFGH
jgi:hypothetical protein